MKKQTKKEITVATIFVGAIRKAKRHLGNEWECLVDTVRFDHHYGLVIDDELIYNYSSQLPDRGILSTHYQDYTNSTLHSIYGKSRSLIMDHFERGKERNVALYDQDCRTQAEIIAQYMRMREVETFVIEEGGRLDNLGGNFVYIETDRMNYIHSYTFRESLKTNGMTEINVDWEGNPLKEGKIIRGTYKISKLNQRDSKVS